jgi:hypothetical protein
MQGLTDWARDLLISRGALLEQDQGALRALLPAEVAGALGCGEWLSLNFESSAGADDGGEWIDRLGSLLPPNCPVIGARLRERAPVSGFDAAGVLDRELVIQNGVYRLVEDYSGMAQYFLCTIQYAVESDDRNIGFFTVGVNASAESMTRQPSSLLRALQDGMEDDPAFELPLEPLRKMAPVLEKSARREARALISGFEQTANRRLMRDRLRVDTYYRGLLAQIEKRITRKSTAPETIAKERSRADATELDRQAKLEDLRRKYSLRVRLSLADVLAIRAPVREISVRLIRKKEQRNRILHWNAIVRRLEPPMCEKCSGAAHPIYLCDDKVHILCQECMAPCAGCGKTRCRVCQSKCKCGSSSLHAD